MYLTAGPAASTMVVAAVRPRRQYLPVSTRGGEMSAQFRSPVLKGRQTCRFLARFNAGIAA
jgi:hypothetical protein